MKKTSYIFSHDPVCAISTPMGEGGIHVIRISGKKVLPLAFKIFKPKDRKIKCRHVIPRMVYMGSIVDENKNKVDEALLTYFKAPQSYTGEDCVEISVHGNLLLGHSILRFLVRAGARLAEAGEFTKRAFLNGKLDLTQAEAVNELISAKTKMGCDIAMQHLSGELSKQMLEIKAKIVEVLAEVEAFVDFPEEDIEVYSNVKLLNILEKVDDRLHAFAASYEHGEIVRNGIQTVIVGKPNVGKSSLLNTLLKRDRALVSDIPGTTRDSIEELIDIEGILFRVIDTAGIRTQSDTIETMSISRTREEIKKARLCIFVLDSSSRFGREDKKILESISGKDFIVVLNKSDLKSNITKAHLKKYMNDRSIISISTKTKKGIAELEKTLVDIIWHGTVGTHELMITSERQCEAVLQTKKSIEHAIASFKQKLSLEFIAFDLREALENLCEVVGEVYTDDILDVIFSKFCIGK